jgi:hypothetical protein
MRFILIICLALRAFGQDFDCVFVGTSPVSLFEALYRYESGQSVLILEESDVCGGAWKSIEICGVPRVDMGCHEIGPSPETISFLEEYGGCKIVEEKGGKYFSRGCFELIDNLLQKIQKTDIALLTNTKLKSVFLDFDSKRAILKTPNGSFTAAKIVVTPGSSIRIENAPNALAPERSRGTTFFHLYLLIQDPSPHKFTYFRSLTPGSWRMMNMTPFLDLGKTGRQLIAFQTHGEKDAAYAETLLEDLKQSDLVDKSAYLLQVEPYVYEQYPHFSLNKLAPEQKEFFDMLDTSHFNMIGTYAPRWKQLLK